MKVDIKDWLGAEHARNKEHAALYVEIVKRAIGKLTGRQVEVLIGHHITFELGCNGALDITTENEIPSADCLMFDHTIMRAVFGINAVPLMMHLASIPCEERDAELAAALEGIPANA